MIQDITIPKTEYELFRRRMNDFTSKVISSSIFSTKIAVRSPRMPYKHHYQPGNITGLCYCDHCFGDFSGAHDE